MTLKVLFKGYKIELQFKLEGINYIVISALQLNNTILKRAYSVDKS